MTFWSRHVEPTAQRSFAPVRTLIPARLDRLPWGRFHRLVILALGVTWILDGLEVTLMGAIGGVLQDPGTLHLTSADVGLTASCYLVGAVLGALVFGLLTDRLGRRLLFFVTLGVYLVGALLTCLSWDLWSLLLFRFITGAGIGGEYAAINSAIDELVPARLRGRLALFINGSYWLGAAAGSLATLVFLDPRWFAVDLGWRIGLGLGAVLCLFILGVRRHVPESPRWLIVHGRAGEADAIIDRIEQDMIAGGAGPLAHVEQSAAIEIFPRAGFNLIAVLGAMFGRYWRRSLLAFALMVSQAFLYNAIFFTYALVLTQFYQVPAGDTGFYLLPFALSNFLGVILLGSFFDTVGRRHMIAATYTASALMLLLTGYLFAQDLLTAATLTGLWTLIFFVASPAASSAYLTVSEIFPLETRGFAIAVFYALGTAIGGVVAPWLFGTLIGTGSRQTLFYGYVFAAGLMLAAAIVVMIFGIAAERKGLEAIAEPLSAAREREH